MFGRRGGHYVTPPGNEPGGKARGVKAEPCGRSLSGLDPPPPGPSLLQSWSPSQANPLSPRAPWQPPPSSTSFSISIWASTSIASIVSTSTPTSPAFRSGDRLSPSSPATSVTPPPRPSALSKYAATLASVL